MKDRKKSLVSKGPSKKVIEQSKKAFAINIVGLFTGLFGRRTESGEGETRLQRPTRHINLGHGEGSSRAAKRRCRLRHWQDTTLRDLRKSAGSQAVHRARRFNCTPADAMKKASRKFYAIR